MVDAQQELENLPDPFMDKLLSYLRQDVFRNIPTHFFKEDCKTLSTIRHVMNFFEINGKKPIFLKEITNLPDSAFFIPSSQAEISVSGDE